jgi:hypothetical protein
MIFLIKKHAIIIDEEDLNRVSSHKWRAYYKDNILYINSVYPINGHAKSLSKFLLCAENGASVRHKNGNKKDFSKSNLEVAYLNPVSNTFRSEEYEKKKQREKYRNRYQKQEVKSRIKANNKRYLTKNADSISLKNKTKWIKLKEDKEKYESLKKKRLNRRKQLNVESPISKIKYNLRKNLSSAIKRSQKSGSAVKSLGCSVENFKKQLEQKFYNHPQTNEVMDWSNYGRWHIDHIKPLSKFDLSNKNEFDEVCHYTNLQPLWNIDNWAKGNK